MSSRTNSYGRTGTNAHVSFERQKFRTVGNGLTPEEEVRKREHRLQTRLDAETEDLKFELGIFLDKDGADASEIAGGSG